MSNATKSRRELDALIAEKVMGWRVPKWKVSNVNGDCMIPPSETLKGLTWTGHVDFEGDRSKVYWTPPYSTDIAAAWEIVDKLKLLEEWCLFKGVNNEWVIRTRDFSQHGDIARAFSVPHVICLAALKAVEGDEK